MLRDSVSPVFRIVCVTEASRNWFNAFHCISEILGLIEINIIKLAPGPTKARTRWIRFSLLLYGTRLPLGQWEAWKELKLICSSLLYGTRLPLGQWGATQRFCSSLSQRQSHPIQKWGAEQLCSPFFVLLLAEAVLSHTKARSISSAGLSLRRELCVRDADRWPKKCLMDSSSVLRIARSTPGLLNNPPILVIQQPAVQSSILFLSRTVDRILHPCYSNRQLLVLHVISVPHSWQDFADLFSCKGFSCYSWEIVPAFCWKDKNDQPARRAGVDQ